MVSFYDQIAANKRNSYIILFIAFLLSFIAIYAFSIVLFGGNELSIIISTIFAIGYLAITYTISDSLILSVSGAREAKKEEYPYLVNVVEGLSIAAGIPTPKIYVIDDPALNAFAVGKSPDRAAVAFTTGLLNNLNRAELEGVVAHEISHIRNYDSRMATIAIGMVGLIAILSEVGLRGLFWGRGQSRRGGGGILVLIGLLILILAPILAQLVRLALSRQREYLADASGAQLTRYPEGLASALEKIKKLGSHVQKASDTTAPLYIANPLSVGSLFSTHPPIDERIRILREM